MKTLKKSESLDENEVIRTEEEAWRPTPLVGGPVPTEQEGKASSGGGDPEKAHPDDTNVLPLGERHPEDPFFPPLW